MIAGFISFIFREWMKASRALLKIAVLPRGRIVCALLILCLCSASYAQPNNSPARTITISRTRAAQILIANGKLEAAKSLLERELRVKPNDSEILFLLGTIAFDEKHYDQAVSYYRKILVNEPNADRVRLELARAFFMKGDYDNADRQFRFARAGNLPDSVKANIDYFLGAIMRLREWTFNFSVGLAPDTNENAATNLQQVQIYGLPFTLDANARQKGGIGAIAELGGEWSPLLTDSLKARIGVDTYRAQYGNGNFDDMTLASYAGPQYLFHDGDVSALLTGFQRWYANVPYNKGVGARLAGDYSVLPQLVISASFSAQYVQYHQFTFQNGGLYTLQMNANYILSPSSLFQMLGGVSRQGAEIAPYAAASRWIGVGYQQDLPYGISASVQPSFVISHYDAPLEAFGLTRLDHTVLLGLNLLDRRLEYHGFTPRLSYLFTDNRSNIGLYSYTRSQFDIGITSQF